MAKTLLIQYYGDASTTAFTIPTIAAGYVPFCEVDGVQVSPAFTTNTFTFAVAPAVRSLINIGQQNASVNAVVAGAVAYLKTDTGTKTLAAADALVDRMVFITVKVTTAFATGDGAQPTLSVGETSTVAKFIPTADFVTKALGTYTYSGVLAATKALLATLVAGTGSTEAGAYTIDWLITPKS